MIITEALIDLDLKTSDKLSTIERLSEMALEDNRLDDKEGYIDYINEVLNREAQVSTDLGDRIAIPHGKSDSVKEPFVVFAKLHDPIIWNEEENSVVDLVFMLGVPGYSESNTHLKLISQLATKLIDEDFLDTLRSTKDKQFILNYFNTIKL